MSEISPKARIAVAAALGLGLLVAILLVVIAGSKGEEASFDPPDPACLREWNRAPDQVTFGRHLFSAHSYVQVQVLRVAPDGGPLPSGAGGGLCAVSFAAQTLDPEPGAAAQVFARGRWSPLTVLPAVDSDRLIELQRTAFEDANAELDDQGRLSPLAR